MLVHATYGVIGLLPFVVPAAAVVPVAIAVWALSSVPQLIVPIAFNVVMSMVAGPNGRFELLSRRWSLAVLSTALTVAAAGRVLDWLPFPLNYQVVLVTLSLSGPISVVLMDRLRLPQRQLPPSPPPQRPVRERAADFTTLIRGQPAFVSFIARQLPFSVGTRMAGPLIPLFYVTTMRATDGEIGLIATVQSFALLVGYLGWTRLWRRRGGRVILLICGAGLGLYPAGLAVSREIVVVLGVTAAASLFQAGLQLVMFDELVRRVPVAYAPTFYAVEQNVSHLAGLGAPLLGAALAAVVGLPLALVLAAAVSLVGYGLLALDLRPTAPAPIPQEAT
jgi:Na+/melibiose symporter-like transporter